MYDASFLEELLQDNRHRLVPEGSPLPNVIDIKVGKPMFSRENMYHQSVTVTCEIAGKISCVDLWAKCRPGIHEAFATLDAVCKRMGEGIFPTPILAWHSNGGDSLLLTARINGETLRNRLIRTAFFRETEALSAIFYSNGSKMRKFHDASEKLGSLPLKQFVDRAVSLVHGTTFFSPREKVIVLQHLNRYQHTFRSVRELPLRKMHHDWTLRNILIDSNGVDYLVDFDSLQAPASSRWLEVMCFMLNLESQAKWSPIVTRDMLTKLWSCFWHGYTRNNLPECMPDEIPAIFYMARLYHLLGGTFRVPLFRKHRRLIDKRFIGPLKQSVLCGEFSTLTWNPGADSAMFELQASNS